MYKKFLFLFPLVISISLFSQENDASGASEEDVAIEREDTERYML